MKIKNANISDNEIKKILIEKKKKERQREDLHEFAAGFAGFCSMIIICFMLTLIG